ncbi:hypothetical protein BS47DRAFT_1362186 [Hydnum rufescens UP504]|uniref:Uncharacterized protein n=1 Tax=Hydnum rufescens UP504 TaxID=1448309 RepID=A0A9P6AY21_9AGAM|nr:hypothetical protein BS47DRAFT_1362186 [Hydnum rufescens UP504]
MPVRVRDDRNNVNARASISVSGKETSQGVGAPESNAQDVPKTQQDSHDDVCDGSAEDLNSTHLLPPRIIASENPLQMGPPPPRCFCGRAGGRATVEEGRNRIRSEACARNVEERGDLLRAAAGIHSTARRSSSQQPAELPAKDSHPTPS